MHIILIFLFSKIENINIFLGVLSIDIDNSHVWYFYFYFLLLKVKNNKICNYIRKKEKKNPYIYTIYGWFWVNSWSRIHQCCLFGRAEWDVCCRCNLILKFILNLVIKGFHFFFYQIIKTINTYRLLNMNFWKLENKKTK